MVQLRLMLPAGGLRLIKSKLTLLVIGLVRNGVAFISTIGPHLRLNQLMLLFKEQQIIIVGHLIGMGFWPRSLGLVRL